MAKSSSSKNAKNPPRPRPLTGLGRGLTEIIAQGAHTPPPTSSPAQPTVATASGVREVSLSQIVANPRQPRVRFAEEPLDELVTSIQEHGVLQPITVRPKADGFEIIAGERRFRASKKAGKTSIPVIVKAVSDVEACELALVENLQRENLNPIEEGRGYRELGREFSLTQEQVAQKVGKNRATVANAMRLLDLPEEVQGYLSQERLSAGHAKAILGLTVPEQQIHLARTVIKDGLNVRQTEAVVARQRPATNGSSKGKSSATTTGGDLAPHLRAIQNALQQKFATRVFLHSAGNGGKIEIQYYTPSDLDRMLEILSIQL